MSFCQIDFKRKQDTIEVKNKRGEESSLYSNLVYYVNQNGVPEESMWFFNTLKDQGKLKSLSNYELALGLYSIAYNSDKSEQYWSSRIEQLIPYKVSAEPTNNNDESDGIHDKGFTNSRQYIEFIANNNEPFNPLAKKLLNFKTNVPILLSENLLTDEQLKEKGITKASGVYYQDKNEIGLHPLSGSRTIIHEQLHAVTSSWLKENKNSPEVKELEKLYEVTKSYSKELKEVYPLSDIDEFIVGIFTNAQFISDLQKIPYKGTNILTELIKWMSNLFRFTPKQQSLFEEVFFHAEQLLDKIETQEKYENEFTDAFEDLVDTKSLESDYQKILDKYGKRYKNSNEINPNVDWGKLISSIADVNRKYGKSLTLYQAPNSNWYLKMISETDSPSINKIPNYRILAEINASEMKVQLGTMGEDIVDNWDKYFDDYSFLSLEDKQIYASLIENGQVQIQCKL